MGNKAGVRHYFVEGLTTRGQISLLPLMSERWQRLYILLGGPGMGKSTMIKMIGLELLDRGFEVDLFRSARETDSVAGFVLEQQGIAMLDVIEMSPLQFKAPGLIEKFIDFTPYCDERKLTEQRLDLMTCMERRDVLQKELEWVLIEEFGSHSWKKTFQPERKENRPDLIMGKLNFNKTGPWPLAQNVLQKLQQSQVHPYFLHGLSAQGWLNLAPHFLADYDQIRLAGEDKGAAIHWVLHEAQQLGQIMEIILHPLNPDEIIGILFPERKLAIWQGDPENIQEQGIEPKLNDKITETFTAWETEMSLIKSIYTQTMDFGQVDALRVELLNQILRSLEY